MKKIASLLFVVILMVTLIVPAFAKPVPHCEYCDGVYKKTIVISDWHKVLGTAIPHRLNDFGDWHWDGPYWEERTVAYICTKGEHRITQKRNYDTKHNINLSNWGWGMILN